MSTSERFVFVQMIEKIYNDICSPSYQPTAAAETKAVKAFQTSLGKVKTIGSYGSLDILTAHLKCVMALSKKDEEFITSYFKIMDRELNAVLVDILRNQSSHLGEHYIMYLEFMLELIKIETQKTIISTLDIHHALTANILTNPDAVAYCMDILGNFLNNDQIRRELANMKTIDWICGNVERMIKVNCDKRPQYWGVVIRILQFAVVVVGENPKSFKGYVNNLLQIFVKASQASSGEVRQAIRSVEHELLEILRQPYTSSQNPSSRPAQSASDENQTKERRIKELSIADLKRVATSDTEKYLYPTGMAQKPLQRHSYIEKLDPDLNVYIESETIAKISLEYLAEVTCGILNSNRGGIIYIGIASNGRVTGVDLKKDGRDEFRQSMDKIFLEHITPLVPPQWISIEFTRVFQVTGDLSKASNLWIIKITLPANFNKLFYLRSTKQCFMRQGKANVLLSLREIREATVAMIERRETELRNVPF